MAERDFEIGSRKFKLSKINAMKQFHIVRRITPILSDLIPVAQKFSRMNEKQLSEMKEEALEILGPIMTGISKLSDKDSDLVLIGLLSAVEMQQESGNWAKLANENGMMFNDLDLPVLLQAAGRSFMFNMSGFFAVLPQVS